MHVNKYFLSITFVWTIFYLQSYETDYPEKMKIPHKESEKGTLIQIVSEVCIPLL